jgi:hypothetical protein
MEASFAQQAEEMKEAERKAVEITITTMAVALVHPAIIWHSECWIMTPAPVPVKFIPSGWITVPVRSSACQSRSAP